MMAAEHAVQCNPHMPSAYQSIHTTGDTEQGCDVETGALLHWLAVTKHEVTSMQPLTAA